MSFRSKVFLSALLALVLGAPAFAADDEAAAPRMVIPEPIAELGTVDRGQTVPHEFVVRNEGTAPLEILEVRPGGTCTVAEFDRVIPPGGEGKIRTKLDTTDLEGGTATGISVLSNDPETPRTQLTMRVLVAEYLTFSPGFARFVKGHGHTPGVVQNRLYSASLPELAIEKVESPYPFLAVEVKPATEEERKADFAGNQYVVTTTVDYEQAPVGPIVGNVILHTNHPRQPLALLPVSGFVRPLVAVTPAEANFGEIKLTEPTTARFLVQNFGAAPLKVTGVDAGLPTAEGHFKAIEEGRRYSVELVLGPSLPKGRFSTEITIRTDSSTMPVIVVPVSGTVM